MEEIMKVVKCILCGIDTTNRGTRMCDACWELSTRITMDENLAVRVLKGLGYTIYKDKEEL
jgi:hypothetical protein